MKHHTRISCVLILAVLAITTTSSLEAALVPIVGVTGHNNRSNFGADQQDMINGSGMDLVDPNDPSTWRAISNSFQDEWQSGALVAGGTNGKIGWATLDFGSSTANLENLYLWNIREDTAQNRRVNQYNVYYAETPTVAPPVAPTDNSAVDYDFSSGGWTLLNDGGPLSLAQRGAQPDPANAVIDLGGVSARYIGLEILSNFGDTSRTGFAEVGVTFTVPPVPEPSTLTLAAVGFVGLVVRRRRRR
ncbi:MAG: PEP-CTERM sorting domain-containing protein [Pirellulales bacterium]|nr:PEP-CTERM sorting domain-containing protein [Pirellulales bacterium]